jgi:hypothetical protein
VTGASKDHRVSLGKEEVQGFRVSMERKEIADPMASPVIDLFAV